MPRCAWTVAHACGFCLLHQTIARLRTQAWQTNAATILAVHSWALSGGMTQSCRTSSCRNSNSRKPYDCSHMHFVADALLALVIKQSDVHAVKDKLPACSQHKRDVLWGTQQRKAALMACDMWWCFTIVSTALAVLQAKTKTKQVGYSQAAAACPEQKLECTQQTAQAQAQSLPGACIHIRC